MRTTVDLDFEKVCRAITTAHQREAASNVTALDDFYLNFGKDYALEVRREDVRIKGVTLVLLASFGEVVIYAIKAGNDVEPETSEDEKKKSSGELPADAKRVSE